MNSILERIAFTKRPIPCLFYPVGAEAGVSVAELLTDSDLQARILLEIAERYPVGAVVRMSELWCEAAAFGMECAFVDNDFPRLGPPLYTDAEALASATAPPVVGKVTEPLIEAVEKAARCMEKPLIVGATGPYTLGSVLGGSADFMMNCMMEADVVHDFLSTITTYLIGYITAYKSAGAAAVMIAEPSVAMISPDMVAEFSGRYLQKIIGAVQDDGFSVIYHNCGAVNPHLDGILQLDADAFHFGSDVDIAAVMDRVGEDRLVMGNVEPRLFLGGRAGEIEDTARSLLRRFSGLPNWRLSTGCDLSPASLEENISAFFRAAKS